MTIATEKKIEPRAKLTALYIEPLCMKKINFYTQAADGEVSGLGTIIKDATGRYIVNNVYLLDQECTGTETDLDPAAISDLMVAMIGRNEDPGQLKFWWHSHVNMGVFWSGTDDIACETLSREFAFSLVVNKKRESKCRLDLYNPFRITFDNLPVIELPEAEDTTLKDSCEAEVKAKVKSPKYNYPASQHGYHSGHHRNYDGYPEYEGYQGSEFFGNRNSSTNKPYSLWGDKKRVKLSDVVVDDIERLVIFAEEFRSENGVFCKKTWDSYIADTMEQVFDFRLKPQAGCTTPLTFDKTFAVCTNGKCKVHKKCEALTGLMDKTKEALAGVPATAEQPIACG